MVIQHSGPKENAIILQEWKALSYFKESQYMCQRYYSHGNQIPDIANSYEFKRALLFKNCVGALDLPTKQSPPSSLCSYAYNIDDCGGDDIIEYIAKNIKMWQPLIKYFEMFSNSNGICIIKNGFYIRNYRRLNFDANPESSNSVDNWLREMNMHPLERTKRKIFTEKHSDKKYQSHVYIGYITFNISQNLNNLGSPYAYFSLVGTSF